MRFDEDSYAVATSAKLTVKLTGQSRWKKVSCSLWWLCGKEWSMLVHVLFH